MIFTNTLRINYYAMNQHNKQ